MKKKRLRYFIALMTFALVGLISLQFYWVKVAVDVNHERFQQNVHEALNQVAQKLEQKEILYIAEQSIGRPIQIADLVSGPIDSTSEESKNSEEVSNLETSPDELAFIDMDTNQGKQPVIHVVVDSNDIPKQKLKKWSGYSLSLSQEGKKQEEPLLKVGLDSTGVRISGDALKPSDKQPTTTVFIQPSDSSKSSPEQNLNNWNRDQLLQFTLEARLRTKQDASKRPEIIKQQPMNYGLGQMYEDQSNNSQREIVRIISKTDMVHYVMDQLKQLGEDIRKRIKPRLLETLIHRELLNRGIQLDYLFMVESRKANASPTFMFANSSETRDLILSSGYNVNLFPTDFLGNQSILHIYFPNQQAYILKSMGGVLLSSLLFVGLIIFCFAYAVSTIIKQKKLSEITNDFINNMTHELKTPISTVSLACEAIQDPDIRQIPTQVDRYLKIIKEENDRLGSQVERVLQIAVLDRGDFKLKINQVNIHEIIGKAMRNIVIQIENRQGEVRTHLEAEQPYLEGDEVHITNMVFNLLDNANKYSPNPPEIDIYTQSEENGIAIKISDKGQGMNKETVNKIFDKFFRVSTGNIHNVKGFGLGLSYVKTMTEAHFGNVSVKSEINKGSTFTLFLPYQHTNVGRSA